MWTTLQLAGHRCDLFQPEGAAGVVIALHDRDAGTLPDDPFAATSLTHERLACCCPHGGESWWADRISPFFRPDLTAERWLLDQVVPHLHSLHFTTFALIGRGMGGQGALRLALKHPALFRIVAALDAAIDHYEVYDDEPSLQYMYDSREHCRQDSATLHIHPARQPAHIWFACPPSSAWHRGNDRLHEKLAALGVAHTFVEEPRGYDAAFKFVRNALSVESRRLL